MGMNDTPSGERVHIGFFGRRNAGKSSVVNAVTGQDLSVVSDTRGTTTDPVRKAMELLPLGPVMIIDTPGFDDEGALGELRVRKTRQVLNRTDLAVLIVDASEGLKEADRELMRLFQEKDIPSILVWNKWDLMTSGTESETTGEKPETEAAAAEASADVPGVPAGIAQIRVSAVEGTNIWELKELMAKVGAAHEEERCLVRDLVEPLDPVVLVIPIDKAAPKGRLILPQQQVIRDLLDKGAVPICVRDTELAETLERMRPEPKLVITDSQAFRRVSAEVPDRILLTSFSILMARYKGLLEEAVRGAAVLDHLKDGDRILISEGCTHHRQCDDIGTYKLPKWIRAHSGVEPEFVTSSGREFPEDLSGLALIVHCGGCMLNEREVRYRMKSAGDQGVPITNYGIAIAHMNGILKRSLQIFPDLAEELN